MTFLVGAVVILMNLERTFRASVGTMRWRIKYMILGLGLLFVVRTYTASQILLFRSIGPAWMALNSGALVMVCLLMSRSLLRTEHFELQVYPSHAVLSGSLTLLLAGTYLFVVGVFAKMVTFFGGDAAFTLKVFVILLSLVLLAVLLQSDRLQLRLRPHVRLSGTFEITRTGSKSSPRATLGRRLSGNATPARLPTEATGGAFPLSDMANFSV